MNIDLASLFFNSKLSTDGGTPSWGTALGQSSPNYKFSYPGFEEILIGMNYCSIPLNDSISCKLGKGGKIYNAIESQNPDSKYEIILASIFKKTFIKFDSKKIQLKNPFCLLITRENENVHKGRRTLKYSDSICTGTIKNKDLYDEVSLKLGGYDSCWFAYSLNIENQDELIFSIVKVADNSTIYKDSQERKNKWLPLIPQNDNDEYIEVYENQDDSSNEIPSLPALNDYEIFAIPKHNEITGSKEEVKNALIQILKNHKETNTTYIPQKIGFEYAEIMKFHNFQSGDIKEVLAAVEISDNRSAECLSSLKLYDFCLENFKVSAPSVQQYFKNLNSTISKNLFPFTPSQSIFYGVPGCGKSFHVKKELERLRIDGEHTVRVVFHPDYSNADFVGQIYPDNSDYGKVVYKFKPGPFSKILKKAYLNPGERFCLVIEEINRGNAAAIFGDLFQLLDRIEKPEDAQTEGVSEGSGNNYGVGWSAYGVDNDSINGYFRSIDDSNKSKEKLPENVTAKNFEGDENPHWYESLDISIKDDDELKSYIHFNANTAIRLPPNLSILATMNTSDQNVFTLDNAFQRRWKMEYIANKLDETSAQYNLEIANTGVKWGGFHKAINQLIKDKTSEFNFGSTEDKCLGGYFITGANDGENKGKIDGKEFAEKVLKFLWDDVFKMDHSVAFKENIKSFTDLLTAFNEGKTNTFNEILKINLYDENANANV